MDGTKDIVDQKLNDAADEVAEVCRKYGVDGAIVLVHKSPSGLYQSVSRLNPSNRTAGFIEEARVGTLSPLDGAELAYGSYHMSQSVDVLAHTLHELVMNTSRITNKDSFDKLLDLQRRMADKQMREFTGIGKTADA